MPVSGNLFPRLSVGPIVPYVGLGIPPTVARSGARTDLVVNGNEVIPSAVDVGLRRDEIHGKALMLSPTT